MQTTSALHSAAEMPAGAERQPLNPLDMALRSVDLTIRGMGYPGFETQMLVWLAGRIDTLRMQLAIGRLARRHPTITARLVEDSTGKTAAPYWQPQPEIEPHLEEVDLPSDDPEQVVACAEKLLSIPHDPAKGNALRFHLLHRPDGRDVFLLQYNHVLMDNRATVLLLQELDQLCRTPVSLDDQPCFEPRGLVSKRLRPVSHSDRRKAALAAVELQGYALRGRAAILGTGEEDKPRRVKLRIATRTIDPDVTRAIQLRGVELCGLPSLSMTILACAFRAIRALGPESRNASRNYVAGIGLDVNVRGNGQALLQNMASVVPITARPGDLTDRDLLVRALSRQMRDRLESKIDLGVLRLARVFQRRPRHVHWVLEYMLRWSYSLWYAYFGALDAVRQLCDVPVEQIYYVGPTWSPIGFSLLVNQYRGRLLLQATYDPELIAPPLADQMLDTISADLGAFAGGSSH